MLRAVAAGLLGNKTVAADAYRELAKKFPEIVGNPVDTIRIYFHFDHWVDAMLKEL